MKPKPALRRQMEQYRRMTGEDRLALGLDLHELACDMARAGIRTQHPAASDTEVEHLLNRRLQFAIRAS